MNIYHLLPYSPIVPADEDHSLFDINGIISICELTTALSTQCLDCRLTDDLYLLIVSQAMDFILWFGALIGKKIPDVTHRFFTNRVSVVGEGLAVSISLWNGSHHFSCPFPNFSSPDATIDFPTHRYDG
jgi:hypothetical protein